MEAIIPQTSEKSLRDMLPVIVQRIGDTPLIPLDSPNPDVSLFAKAEWMNPGGSVKDRAARSIILEALNSNELQGKELLDASSGNTAIAYAMISSAMKIPLTICIPENASRERIQMLRAYGANLVLTDRMEGTDGAIEVARELATDSKYYYADQYNNDANWLAHYRTTGVEIIDQTAGQITHFVSGLGTSGTFMGTSRRLKEEIPDVKVISFQPDSPFHGIEGLKHMETAITPGIYDQNLADRNIVVNTKRAIESTVELTRTQGLFVGVSSGAAYTAAIELAHELESGVIVTIFPDRGERYLSERFWGSNS